MNSVLRKSRQFIDKENRTKTDIPKLDKSIMKPEYMEDMRSWRSKHGFTSPEWEIYSKAMARWQYIAFCFGCIVGGFVVRLMFYGWTGR